MSRARLLRNGLGGGQGENNRKINTMAWIILTKQHIEDRLATDELECIEDTGGGDGDRLTGILDQVTALVRGYVASCRYHTLGAAGTIPEECLHVACTIAKLNIRATLPTTDAEDAEVRQAEYNDAVRFLEQVAQCKIKIDSTEANASNRNTSASTGGETLMDFSS